MLGQFLHLALLQSLPKQNLQLVAEGLLNPGCWTSCLLLR